MYKCDFNDVDIAQLASCDKDATDVCYRCLCALQASGFFRWRFMESRRENEYPHLSQTHMGASISIEFPNPPLQLVDSSMCRFRSCILPNCLSHWGHGNFLTPCSFTIKPWNIDVPPLRPSRFCEFWRDKMAEGVVEVDTLFRVLGVCLPNLPFFAVSNGGTLRYILGSTDCRGEKSWRPEGVVSMPSPWTGKE